MTQKGLFLSAIMFIKVILYLLLYKSKKITLSSSFIYLCVIYAPYKHFTLKTNMEAQKEWKYSTSSLLAETEPVHGLPWQW